jgi:hypothetical protein
VPETDETALAPAGKVTVAAEQAVEQEVTLTEESVQVPIMVQSIPKAG